MKTKTALFDDADIFHTEIEEVLEYFCDGMLTWALVQYASGKVYAVPLYGLAIKHRPVFND